MITPLPAKAKAPIVSDQLLEHSWRLFDSFDDVVLVRPSIPIPYFGDAEGYSRSPIRIVTVGLNPSRHEFPRTDPYLRFPTAHANVQNDGARIPANHRLALNSYFRHAPYMDWFGAYEAILNGADASYRPGARTIAVHTDVCSPLATDPTWNQLAAAQHAALEPGGAELWNKLVAELQPQIIIASVAIRHLGKLTFERTSNETALLTIQRRHPFVAYQQWVQVGNARCLVVWGRPLNLPFGSVSKVDRMRIGAAAAKAFTHG